MPKYTKKSCEAKGGTYKNGRCYLNRRIATGTRTTKEIKYLRMKKKEPMLADVSGVGLKLTKELAKKNIYSCDDVQSEEQLTEVKGLGKSTAEKILRFCKMKITKKVLPEDKKEVTKKAILKLPHQGDELIISLEPNANGARTLTVKNWKGLRLYINYDYRTEYNQKSKSLGWIATDASDWDLQTQYVPDDVKNQVKQIKEQTKQPKPKEKTKKSLGTIEIINYGDGTAAIAGSLKHHGSALTYEVEDTLEKNKSDWINKTHQSFPSKNISEVEKTLDKYYDVKVVSIEEYKKETEKMIALKKKKRSTKGEKIKWAIGGDTHDIYILDETLSEKDKKLYKGIINEYQDQIQDKSHSIDYRTALYTTQEGWMEVDKKEIEKYKEQYKKKLAKKTKKQKEETEHWKALLEFEEMEG